MSGMLRPLPQDLEELLVDRALGELAAADSPRLVDLLGASGVAPEDPTGIDVAVAALDLAAHDTADAAMPESLRAAIAASAPTGRRAARPSAPRGGRPAASAGRRSLSSGQKLSIGLSWVAAAAGLTIGVVALSELSGRGAGPVEPAEPTVAVAEAPTADEIRTELLGEAPDVLDLSWTATEDETAAGAGGRVVWSDARQQGVMAFSGLAVNDPDEFQYQLWIFDAERDDAFPVDGGVFDVVSAEGETLVEIDPKLPVSSAVLFAVTVERPGGVVVSDRSRIAVLAQPSPA